MRVKCLKRVPENKTKMKMKRFTRMVTNAIMGIFLVQEGAVCCYH